MAELNATAASLLGFLHDGPKTGWDLLQEIDAGFRHFWNVTSSHVYRELKGLHERGYIQPEERSARDRQPYSITDEGRRAFAEWLAREPGGETMRIPLLVTLWFGDRLEPELLREFLANHRKVNAERLERYRTAPADRMAADPYFAAVVEFGIAYEEAVLRWLERLNDLPGLDS